MKHILRNILCLLLLAGLSCLLPDACSPSPASARAEGEDLPEWTVMLYMCGSDLESRHGLATYNLNDILSMWFPEKTTVATDDGVALENWPTGRVNIVAQTGGAKAWRGMEPDEDGRTLGVDIATDRLQRYAFDAAYSGEAYGYKLSMSLADEQPLSSMGDPGTLSDFIRWVAREYPAKKYALVLWDHGGGSRTGLFVDELFDNDILYLHELGRALADGGLNFELVAIDACLMCSLETATTLAPYAHFMVASEEVAAGYGSAYSDWLLELFRNPGCNAAELGREFCDATQRKYVKLGDAMAETQLTYSLIDLSYIDAVAEAFDRLFEFAGLLYEQMPDRFNMFCNFLIYSEKYGAGGFDMTDLGSFLYNGNAMSLLDFERRNTLANALEDAVHYTVKGSGRSASKGLSFCFAPDLAPEDMDLYALNCPSAPYLALLDAVNADWVAPDWVYERTRRLTQIEDFDEYQMEWEPATRGGLPALRLLQRSASFLDCLFKLYRLDEDTGSICLLGTSDTLADWDDDGNQYYVINPPDTWPTLDGELCSVELIDKANGALLYNVPLQLRGARTNLRVRATREYDAQAQALRYSYEALGLWDGYDEDTRMPSRSVTSLYQMEGREYTLLYPCCGLDGEQSGRDLPSAPLTMYRALDIKSRPLPAGTYYCGFHITDVFGHKYDTALTELIWDGDAFSLVG